MASSANSNSAQHPPVWIDDLQVHPSFARQEVTLRGRLGNATGRAGSGTLTFRIERASLPSTAPPPRLHKFPVQWEPDGASFECTLPVSSPEPWDEFHRALYDALAWIEEFGGPWEAKVARFGFRDFAADGTQFTINGRKTFLRGTLECAIFPKTGHTPTDVESWRKVIDAARAHGLNNLRFHSHCPPEAAFRAADELGMYLHVECGTWPNQSTTLGDGKPVDAWLYREADRILQAYGNHPSFVILLHGNEPGGPHHVPFLKRWVDHYKQKDARRLYSSGAGWPQIPENQLHVSPDPRVQGWGQGLASRLNARPPRPSPITAITSPPDLCRSSATKSVSGVSIPTSTRSPSTPATSAAQFRDLPRLPPRPRHARPGPQLPLRLRQAPDPLLQGRHRVRAPHPRHGRVPVARSPRLPRAGHRPRRRA
ncbi:MAG: hypothetical protein M5U12_35885 [Verrucomicrobia bacterium]|nr:hypothetical protein [Verrucomicrobiota bacterium]